MSALEVGTESSTKNTAGDATTTTTSASAPAAIVKWIPGEAVTFYAALLGIGATQGELTGDETPENLLERIDAGSPGWFLAGAAIAVLLVIVGAIAGKTSGATFSRRSVLVRALLVLASFVIWTTALPGSWPYGWTWIRDMGAAYALLLVPIALIFFGRRGVPNQKVQTVIGKGPRRGRKHSLHGTAATRRTLQTNLRRHTCTPLIAEPSPTGAGRKSPLRRHRGGKTSLQLMPRSQISGRTPIGEIMTAPTPILSPLFDFMDIRSPQVLSARRRRRGFVDDRDAPKQGPIRTSSFPAESEFPDISPMAK